MNDEDSTRNLPERRTSAADFHELVRGYHKLDTRVAVVETRMDAQDHRLADIETEIRHIKETVNQVLDKLNQHAAAESTMQLKMMIGIAITFLGVLAGRLGFQLPGMFQ